MTEPAFDTPVIERALILSGGGARGSYQAGVIQYLEETAWVPDLVCGTSIGAVNAAAWGSGVSASGLADLWFTYDRRAQHRFSLHGLISGIRKGRGYSPPADTRGLRRILEKHIDFSALRNNKTRILITAINMKTGQLRYFTSKIIGIDHLMAAAAIPMLFPWQYIDGVPHWDAGLMVNTPIAPALAWNAREIVVVLHSPVGAFETKEPETTLQAFELAMEHVLIGSCTALLPIPSWREHPEAPLFETPAPGSAGLSPGGNGGVIRVVAPPKMPGLTSMFNYSHTQAENLVEKGYHNAKTQLGSHFS